MSSIPVMYSCDVFLAIEAGLQIMLVTCGSYMLPSGAISPMRLQPVGFYLLDEGQRESIRRIISTAKSMLSRNAISRAGEGLPSSAASFLHAKIAAITPSVRFRPSSISFSIGFSATRCGRGGKFRLPHFCAALKRVI